MRFIYILLSVIGGYTQLIAQQVNRDTLYAVCFEFKDKVDCSRFYYIIYDQELYNGDYFLNFNSNASSKASPEVLRDINLYIQTRDYQVIEFDSIPVKLHESLEVRPQHSLSFSIVKLYGEFILFPISNYIPNPFNAQLDSNRRVGLELIKCSPLPFDLQSMDIGSKAILDDLVAHRFQIVGFVQSEYMFYYSLHYYPLPFYRYFEINLNHWPNSLNYLTSYTEAIWLNVTHLFQSVACDTLISRIISRIEH